MTKSNIFQYNTAVFFTIFFTIYTGILSASDYELDNLIPKARQEINDLSFNEAIGTLNEALEIDPENPTTLIMLADVYSMIGEYDKALFYIEKKLSNSNSSYSIVLVSLIKADILYYANSIDQFNETLHIIDNYNVEIKENIRISEFYLKKCESYIYGEKWDRAEECLKIAVDAIERDYWNSFYSFIINTHMQFFIEAINDMSEIEKKGSAK